MGFEWQQDILLFKQKLYSNNFFKKYPEGQKATQNSYFKGKLERIQQEWYKNGAKMEILSYIENHKNDFLHTENFILVDY